MGSPVGAFDLFETVAPLGERHERCLADLAANKAVEIGHLNLVVARD